MSIARIALAYWTAFLTFLCPVFHDNEYNIPSSILLKVFFPCLLKMQSQTKRKCFDSHFGSFLKCRFIAVSGYDTALSLY